MTRRLLTENDLARLERAVERVEQILHNRSYARHQGLHKLKIRDEVGGGSGHSSPTESIAIHQQRIRDEFYRGESHLIQAIDNLVTADDCYSRALKLSDNVSPRDKRAEQHQNADPNWPTKRFTPISKKEHKLRERWATKRAEAEVDGVRVERREPPFLPS